VDPIWLWIKSQKPIRFPSGLVGLAFCDANLALAKSQMLDVIIGGIFKMANMAPKINREVLIDRLLY
jgi:hypothetical protein